MESMRLDGVSSESFERRDARRQPTELYAIELDGTARYLRRVRNVSRDGLLLDAPLAFQHPGEEVELELPRSAGREPLRIKATVVRISEGAMGLKKTDDTPPLEDLGGKLDL